MYVTFDFKCTSCGHREPRFVKKSEMDFQVHTCGDDTYSSMTRLPAAPRTTFRFHDTKLKD